MTKIDPKATDRIEKLEAENEKLQLKVRQLEVTNTNIRLSDARGWCDLKAENRKLKNQIDLMHNNGLGESWVERLDLKGKQEQINQLKVALYALYEATRAVPSKYGCGSARIKAGELLEKQNRNLI